MFVVDDELSAADSRAQYRPHKMPANPCLYHHAGGAVGIWGIITACTLVLRLADTVSMDERGGPQCFSLGSRKAPNIQPRSDHFV